MQDFAAALDKIVYVLQEMDEGRRKAATKKSSRVITVV